jgi:hypothetical protein
MDHATKLQYIGPPKLPYLVSEVEVVTGRYCCEE